MKLENLQEILKDKKFWIFLGILALTAIVGVVILSQVVIIRPKITGKENLGDIKPPDVSVVRVEPLPDQKEVSRAPTVKITFEKSIFGKKIEVASLPKVEFTQTLSSGGYNLVLTPNNLLAPSTKYSLSVLADGVKIYSWSFTTGTKGADPKIVEAIKAKLPYQGNHFAVSYASATDKFFVTIDAKPVDTYKKAALAWFASQRLSNAESAINIVYFPVGEAAD